MEATRPIWANSYSGWQLVLAYLTAGIWISATAGAWLLGLRTIAAGLFGNRRLVRGLRWGTWTLSVNLFGLVMMVAFANPERWRTVAWLLSLVPVGLAMLGVLISARPEPRLSRGCDTPAGDAPGRGLGKAWGERSNPGEAAMESV